MPMSFSRLLALLLLTNTALAGPLGSIGPTYPIIEEDAIVSLQAKLKRMEASGELAKLQNESRERIIRNIEQPAPVTGLTEAKTRSVHYVDLSVSFAQGVSDGDGRVVVPAGTRVNPLEHVSLSKRWVFFDGRDPEQAKKVLAMLTKEGGRIKPVLVAGSFMQTMREWGLQVYFDQYGKLVKRFNITQVPAIVSQDGLKLKIEQMPAGELK